MLTGTSIIPQGKSLATSVQTHLDGLCDLAASLERSQAMEAPGPHGADPSSRPHVDVAPLLLPEERPLPLTSGSTRSASRLTLKLDLHMVAAWLIPSPVGKTRHVTVTKRLHSVHQEGKRHPPCKVGCCVA